MIMLLVVVWLLLLLHKPSLSNNTSSNNNHTTTNSIIINSNNNTNTTNHINSSINNHSNNSHTNNSNNCLVDILQCQVWLVPHNFLMVIRVSISTIIHSSSVHFRCRSSSHIHSNSCITTPLLWGCSAGRLRLPHPCHSPPSLCRR